MKYQYFISSRWRNRDQVLILASNLRKKGKTVYCFIEEKHNPGTPDDDPEEVMAKFEARKIGAMIVLSKKFSKGI